MLSFLPKTPKEIQILLKDKFKKQRKLLEITQQELATKSSVSLGSIKRFEQTGQISLESLLKIAFVLECLEDFERVCERERMERFGSIEEVVK
jgi:transcriptional regulator with XRE-family HTH domain